MNDKGGFLQRKNSRYTIYLLALQSLAKGTIGMLNALLVEIPGKLAARTPKIIVRVGARFPDT
jgi:hypothetical protein